MFIKNMFMNFDFNLRIKNGMNICLFMLDFQHSRYGPLSIFWAENSGMHPSRGCLRAWRERSAVLPQPAPFFALWLKRAWIKINPAKSHSTLSQRLNQSLCSFVLGFDKLFKFYDPDAFQEINLIKRLALEYPDKNVIHLKESLCPNMYKIDPSKLLYTLENIGEFNRVVVPEVTASDARLALDRMLALSS